VLKDGVRDDWQAVRAGADPQPQALHGYGVGRQHGARVGQGLTLVHVRAQLRATPETIHDSSWVIRWTEELKLSWNGNECKPLVWGAATLTAVPCPNTGIDAVKVRRCRLTLSNPS